jgi:hypothetical protein
VTDPNPARTERPRAPGEPAASRRRAGPGSRSSTRSLLRALSVALTILWVLALARDWMFPSSAEALLDHVQARLAMHVPAYALLEEHDPEAYRRVGDAMRSAIEQGQSPAEVALAGGRALGQVVDHYVPYTSEEAITGYASTLVRTLEVIAGRDATLCYDVLYRPAQVPQEQLGRVVPEALANALVQAQGRVIEHALSAASEEVPVERAERLLGGVSRALKHDYGADAGLLWRGEQGHREAGRERVCRMTISMFEIALAMQADERAIVLRHLLSP